MPDRLLTVSGYKLYRRDRPADLNLPKGKGGVAVLVRDTQSSELIPTPNTGASGFNLEIMWVLVRASQHRPVLVASAYRVPVNTVRQLSIDIDDLESQMQFMLARYPRATLLVTGDFNDCLLRARASGTPAATQRLFSSYQMHITNTKQATYRPAGSLLDLVAINRPELVRRAGVTHCHYGGPHDYTRVLIENDRRPVNNDSSHVYRRALSTVDVTAFNERLSCVDWTPVIYSETTDHKWKLFAQIMNEQLDEVAPLRRVRQKQLTSPPVSAETQQLLRDRRVALSAGDRGQYKELNRRCRAAVRRECRERYARDIARGDRGGLWKVLRPVIGSKKQRCEVLNITPDALNAYYIAIGPSTAASVPAPTAPVPVRLPRVVTSAFHVQTVDFDDLYATIASMNSSNSTGLDGLSVLMLQKFFLGAGHALLDVVNSSLASGLVPGAWKHALVTPIPKGKVAAEPSDTRPISILPAIMKVVERIVQRQLSGYLEQTSLIADAQHGYRKYRSTETALHVITDKIYQAMDSGDISILVLLDLSKCFDVVPYSKLLEKLSLYGIHTAWFRSYLSGHTQQVKIRSAGGRDTFSRSGHNGIGVFQGGALSCILYMLFSNDLSLYVPDDVTIVQYADDTQLLVRGKKRGMQRLTTCMEHALNSVYQWFCHNGMRLNAKKTQMLVLGTHAMLRTLPPVTLRFCDTVIHDSRVVKNLGVHLDRHLSFETHVDHMTRKCTGILIALSHARHVIPRETLKSIVEALALSIVRYCLSVYGSCGTTQLHRVQKIVNFCVRVVTGKRRHEHVTSFREQLRWLDATQLVTYHTVCALERIMVTCQPEAIFGTIGAQARQRHDHETRRANMYTLPAIRTESGRRRLCYRGVTMLNRVGVEPGTPGFRSAVKQAIGTGVVD